MLKGTFDFVNDFTTAAAGILATGSKRIPEEMRKTLLDSNSAINPIDGPLSLLTGVGKSIGIGFKEAARQRIIENPGLKARYGENAGYGDVIDSMFYNRNGDFKSGRALGAAGAGIAGGYMVFGGDD